MSLTKHLARAPFPAALLLLCMWGCQSTGSKNSSPLLVKNATENNRFADYWYRGEAELNTYQVEQLRYGEYRNGEAVLVFVTEDFSKSAQVKLDNPQEAGSDKVSVMKLNRIRRFVTGIYDYSMMQSVFTPVNLEEHSHTLKTTTTSQDWCGHTFTQFNLSGDKYNVREFSYFESEGDRQFNLETGLLEDELWTRIRIDPASIREEQVDMIPSTFYARLMHEKPAERQARIRLDAQENITFLILEYLHLDRTLTIGFESVFPYKILSWTEMQDGKTLSKGRLKSSIKSPYWERHDNRHEYLRDSLQLTGAGIF